LAVEATVHCDAKFVLNSFRHIEWLWSGSARFRGNPERRRDIRRGLYTGRLACSSGGHHRHRTLRPPPATMVVVATIRPTPIYVTSFRTCWRSFDPDVFHTDLLASTLCDVQSHNDLDSDVLALLYDSTITGLLDRQVPARSVTCRRRPSSLWFDDECRMAKRNVRRLERAARREGPLASSSSSAATAWRAASRLL